MNDKYTSSAIIACQMLISLNNHFRDKDTLTRQEYEVLKAYVKHSKVEK